MDNAILAFIVQRLLESLHVAVTYVAPSIFFIEIFTFLALNQLATFDVLVRICLRIQHRRGILWRLSFM